MRIFGSRDGDAAFFAGFVGVAFEHFGDESFVVFGKKVRVIADPRVWISRSNFSALMNESCLVFEKLRIFFVMFVGAVGENEADAVAENGLGRWFVAANAMDDIFVEDEHVARRDDDLFFASAKVVVGREWGEFAPVGVGRKLVCARNEREDLVEVVEVGSRAVEDVGRVGKFSVIGVVRFFWLLADAVEAAVGNGFVVFEAEAFGNFFEDALHGVVGKTVEEAFGVVVVSRWQVVGSEGAGL